MWRMTDFCAALSPSRLPRLFRLSEPSVMTCDYQHVEAIMIMWRRMGSPAETCYQGACVCLKRLTNRLAHHNGRKKFAIENREGEKIVSRKKGFTVDTCVSSIPQSQDSPLGNQPREKVGLSSSSVCLEVLSPFISPALVLRHYR